MKHFSKKLIKNKNFLNSQQRNIKVGVIGSGQMGSGIVFVAAQTAKLEVVMTDISDSSINKALQYHGNSFYKIKR